MRTFLVALLAAFVGAGCAKQQAGVPLTAKKPVSETYHGVRVTEEYRWLEDAHDPAVQKWVEEQNGYTRSYLDKLPSRPAIEQRVKELLEERTIRYSGIVERARLFAMKYQPPKNQPFLVVMDSPENPASERVIVDPNEIDPKGTTAIDWFVPSRDGRLVAVSLSENGSEDGSAYVFETATGRKLPDVVPRVQYPTGGGSLEWNREGTGFYYTRYPQGNERSKEDLNFYQQVYFHTLGTPSKSDSYVIGREFPRIAETLLQGSDDGKYLLASVANGDGGEFAHYLMGPTGSWTQITRFSDAIRTAVLGRDNTIYLLSLSGTPRGRILAVPAAHPGLGTPSVRVPEGEAMIEGFIATGTRLYVVYNTGGPSELRAFGQGGKNPTPVLIETGESLAAISGVVGLRGDDILLGTESYLHPFRWYHLRSGGRELRDAGLGKSSSVDLSDAEVVRVFATSKDGTKIPLNIIRKKGITLDATHPALLYGYGGYGAIESPGFNRLNRLWLDVGGVYAVANLRGGGEFGEEWHTAGNLTRKQNVFDDFIACAKLLCDSGYTKPQKLAIQGGSNGGLLMGAVLTQRPEMFRCVVSHVGIYDMLRVELSPNGAFNVTEFGSVTNPEQFTALYAYSPYHRVTDGTPYPAVLMLTGDNDGRVDPANSRKMVARLQAATSSRLPVMLRTTASAGHGIGTGLSERIRENTDVYTFLFDQLDIHY